MKIVIDLSKTDRKYIRAFYNFRPAEMRCYGRITVNVAFKPGEAMSELYYYDDRIAVLKYDTYSYYLTIYYSDRAPSTLMEQVVNGARKYLGAELEYFNIGGRNIIKYKHSDKAFLIHSVDHPDSVYWTSKVYVYAQAVPIYLFRDHPELEDLLRHMNDSIDTVRKICREVDCTDIYQLAEGRVRKIYIPQVVEGVGITSDHLRVDELIKDILLTTYVYRNIIEPRARERYAESRVLEA